MQASPIQNPPRLTNSNPRLTNSNTMQCRTWPENVDLSSSPVWKILIIIPLLQATSSKIRELEAQALEAAKATDTPAAGAPGGKFRATYMKSCKTHQLTPLCTQQHASKLTLVNRTPVMTM